MASREGLGPIRSGSPFLTPLHPNAPPYRQRDLRVDFRRGLYGVGSLHRRIVVPIDDDYASPLLVLSMALRRRASLSLPSPTLAALDMRRYQPTRLPVRLLLLR
jgi:hypothetical protein